MRKEVKEIIVLPFEVGKTYKTKFATGDLFKVSKIIIGTTGINKGKVIGFEGIYIDKEHIGTCPLDGSRLIPEYQETGRVFEICNKCKEALDEENKKLEYR